MERPCRAERRQGFLSSGTSPCTSSHAPATANPCLQVNLHVFGFEMLAPTDLGSVQVKYRRVACSPVDPITIHIGVLRLGQPHACMLLQAQACSPPPVWALYGHCCPLASNACTCNGCVVLR